MTLGGRGGVRVALVLDLAFKAAIVALLVLALFDPDLSHLKQKGAAARVVIYPLGALAVPVWWWVRGRRRTLRPFPWLADLLVTSPWLLDLFSNRLYLFDTVSWWDELTHLTNWLLLTAGVLLAWAPRPRVGRGIVVMVALGFGATAAVLWELGEYGAFMKGRANYVLAYPDTLGDLTLGTTGALVAGLLVAFLGGRRPRADGPVS